MITEIAEFGRCTFLRLWRNRATTLLVLLSLSLGIGANTAIFAVVDAVFLAPLPVKEPHRLFLLFTADPHNPGRLGVSFPNYLDLRKRTAAFESLAASAPNRANLALPTAVHEVAVELVTGNYFSLSGVQPLLGNSFGDAAGKEANHPASAVLSHSLWRKRFQSDPAVIGRTVQINNTPFVISAVMPPGFKGFERVGSTDLWVPMQAYRTFLERPRWITGRRALMFFVVGRLKPGVSLSAAVADTNRIAADLAREYPKENADRGYEIAPLTGGFMGHKSGIIVRAAIILMSAAGAVLLIALANVANVLLNRASVRRREMAVRLAMGATRRALLSQLFAETAVLVVIGGSIGLLFGIAGREMIWKFRPQDITAEDLVLAINGRILLFAALLSLVTGFLASLLPALQSLRGDITTELRERVLLHCGLWKRLPLREALAIAQITLSVVSLVGADLFLKSLQNAKAIDPGFDTHAIASFRVDPGRLGLAGPARLDFYSGLQQKLSALSGIQSVSFSSDPLLSEASLRRTVQLNGGLPPSGGLLVRVNIVGLRYFETSDVLVLRGRDFSSSDSAGAPLVAIVNETMARRFWPNDSAIGKKFVFFGDVAEHTVVGVAHDSVYATIGETPDANAYLPLMQNSPANASVLVRTSDDPASHKQDLAAALQVFHPGLPAAEVVSVRESIDEALWAPRMAAILLTVFGLLALALSSVGIYGVTGHMVAQRTGELGLRMALGACPIDVVELVFRQCLILIVPGLAIGTVAAYCLARFCFQDLLFGVNENDLEPYLVTSLLLALSAFAASYLPARRAVSMHPIMALREQ